MITTCSPFLLCGWVYYKYQKAIKPFKKIYYNFIYFILNKHEQQTKPWSSFSSNLLSRLSDSSWCSRDISLIFRVTAYGAFVFSLKKIGVLNFGIFRAKAQHVPNFLGTKTLFLGGHRARKNIVILLMEEILHQLICRLSHYLPGLIHPRRCRISSINSTDIIQI